MPRALELPRVACAREQRARTDYPASHPLDLRRLGIAPRPLKSADEEIVRRNQTLLHRAECCHHIVYGYARRVVEAEHYERLSMPGNDILKDWHEFYLLAGTAAAALIALLFAASSIGAGVMSPERASLGAPSGHQLHAST